MKTKTFHDPDPIQEDELRQLGRDILDLRSLEEKDAALSYLLKGVSKDTRMQRMKVLWSVVRHVYVAKARKLGLPARGMLSGECDACYLIGSARRFDPEPVFAGCRHKKRQI